VNGVIKNRLRLRFWVELAMLILSSALTLVTLMWSNWIETEFGLDLDEGNGSSEWLVVAGFLGLTTVLLLATRREWRRAANLWPLPV